MRGLNLFVELGIPVSRNRIRCSSTLFSFNLLTAFGTGAKNFILFLEKFYVYLPSRQSRIILTAFF